MSGTVLSTKIVFRPGQGRLHFAADATFGHHEVANPAEMAWWLPILGPTSTVLLATITRNLSTVCGASWTQPAPNGPKVDPFECELCDPPKVFTDRHTLRHHQRVSHRGAS